MIRVLACNYTLFHAVNPTRLEREANENKNLTLLGKIKVGLAAGAIGVGQRAVVSIALGIFTAYFWGAESVPVAVWTFFAGSLGLVDSMVHTAWLGFAQTIVVPSIQRFIVGMVGLVRENWVQHRVVQWIASPSGRIAMISALCAYSYFSFSVDVLGFGSAVGVALRLILLPQEPILFETTTDLVAPIISSLVHCFAVSGITGTFG